MEQDIGNGLDICITGGRFCAFTFRSEYSAMHLLPLSAGKEFFIAAEEGETGLDGYTLRRIGDIQHISANSGDFAARAAMADRPDADSLPPLDLDSTEGLLASLCGLNAVIIIEKYGTPSNGGLIMGRLLDAGIRGCIICPIDFSGVWADTPVPVDAGDIKSISFGRKSLEPYSKLIVRCPFKKSK